MKQALFDAFGPRGADGVPSAERDQHQRGERQLGRPDHPAGAHRARRVPRAGHAVPGVLLRAGDGGGGAGGADPRRRGHRGHLLARRLRGHARHGDRPADDPRLLALRHRRRVRQGQGEHPRPARAHPPHLRRGGQPRGEPDPDALDQHLADRGAARDRAVGRRRRGARRGHAGGPRAGAARRHPGRARCRRCSWPPRCWSTSRCATAASRSRPRGSLARRQRAEAVGRGARRAGRRRGRGARPVRRRRARPAAAAGAGGRGRRERPDAARARPPTPRAGPGPPARRRGPPASGTGDASPTEPRPRPRPGPRPRRPGLPVARRAVPGHHAGAGRRRGVHGRGHRAGDVGGRGRRGRRHRGARASCSARRRRWWRAPAWCRCARRASCRGSPRPARYDLEYGTATLELPADTIAAGARVFVVDDVLATGGTAAATCALLADVGAEVVGRRRAAGARRARRTRPAERRCRCTRCSSI